jgi:hypothetical protein
MLTWIFRSPKKNGETFFFTGTEFFSQRPDFFSKQVNQTNSLHRNQNHRLHHLLALKAAWSPSNNNNNNNNNNNEIIIKSKNDIAAHSKTFQ